MLQVARLAPKVLGEAAESVEGFLRSQLNPDGGFKDRAGQSDLYYTVFGVEGLFALRADVPLGPLETYLRTLGDGEAAGDGLDFVHLACLARCWAMLPQDHPGEAARRSILGRLDACRAADGGYAPTPGQANGTVYNSFLAYAAHQDLKSEVPDPAGLLACLSSLRAADGGYANDRILPLGLTPT